MKTTGRSMQGSRKLEIESSNFSSSLETPQTLSNMPHMTASEPEAVQHLGRRLLGCPRRLAYEFEALGFRLRVWGLRVIPLGSFV